jgi:multiple sugar transport system substrate-binding protein
MGGKMTELSFSAIGDTSEDIEEITRLVKEFQNTSKTSTQVRHLPWNRAWQSLLMSAIEGKGDDVSQVGSTWAPTLAALDSLRPFSDLEVRSMGGPLVFVPAAWQTVRIEGRGEIWAIPWSVYTFVIFYRRDLLQRAGVEESIAFSTPEAMRETLHALQTAGIHPWTMPTSADYLDLPHIASSWARAYGGDFLTPDGKRPYFNTPHARRGLLDFFELCRFIPTELQAQNYEDCLDGFFRKETTAVVIAGTEAYSDALQSNPLSETIRDHIHVAPLPGVPWIGGDHLVVWKTVRFDPSKEHAALDLIRVLTSVENQIRLARETTILPARLDAYTELEFQPEGMRPVLEKILQTARPHPSARLWRRIESMLADMLSDIARSVMNVGNQPVTEIVEPKLAEYEKRFSLLLSG